MSSARIRDLPLLVEARSTDEEIARLTGWEEDYPGVAPLADYVSNHERKIATAATAKALWWAVDWLDVHRGMVTVGGGLVGAASYVLKDLLEAEGIPRPVSDDNSPSATGPGQHYS